MRILGIDPGYAIVGWGVIDKDNRFNCQVVDYGAIITTKDQTFPERLEIIGKAMNKLIDEFKPDALAIEELFFNQNTTTAIAVAEARGVILYVCKQKNLDMYEYTPLQIKQALTGNGRAEKKQVQYMTKIMLKLKDVPKPDDTADAIAVALTHAQTNGMMTSNRIK